MRRAPAAELRPGVANRRVLVVVDDACTAPELYASVRSVVGDQPLEALVLAPAHGTAATQWYVDQDAARADATHRLRTCIACLARGGVRAGGELGDADAVQAITDALHEFPAEEIVLLTARRHPSRWLHRNVIDRARQTFTPPITHVVMPARRNGENWA